MKYRLYLLSGILVCVGLFAGCGRKTEPTSNPPVRPAKMAQAQSSPPSKMYAAAGVLKAVQRAELSFDRPDILVDFPVRQGQEVNEGEVLAKIDMRNLGILRVSAQALYDESDAQYQRVERLYRKEALAQAELDRARAVRETALADLIQVERDIERSVLKAPFAGRIAATYVDRFQAVQARQPVLVLHDISRFDIRIDLPETFILDVGRATNIVAVAVFDHLAGRMFPARLKEFSTEADPATLTYGVVLQMDAVEGENLLPGMSASIQLSIQNDASEGVWVPHEAVFSTDGKQAAVWSVNEQMQVAIKTVQTGTSRKGNVQILTGLSVGETVVISGVHSLREGMSVKPYMP